MAMAMTLGLVATAAMVAAAVLTMRQAERREEFRATEQRDARVRARLEEDARAAVRLEPLRAAIRDRVDQTTLVDLFTSEDWWRPYRHLGCAVLRGGEVLASRNLDPAVVLAIAGGNSERWVAGSAPIAGEPAAVLFLATPATSDPALRDDPSAWPIWIAWALAGCFTLATGWTVFSARRRRPPAPDPSSVSATLLGSETQSFGRYTLTKRLGEGGMSELFTATTTGAEGFKRTFVIKRLKPHLAHDPGAVAQFVDEAKLGSQLVHSNIVPVFDFGKVGEGYFLAQEYVAGCNLAQLAERGGPRLAVALVAYIGHEVLGALAYAHERADESGVPLRIVHRDISPGNIMASVEGEVKLLDFGIVTADTRTASTDPGTVKGSPAFMAPEQARGCPVDRRADLFSLGVVLFELIAGERFYDGGTTGEAVYKAAVGPTAWHLERIAALPQPMGEVLRRALALDPDQRYPRAEAFREVLAGLTTGGKNALASLVRTVGPTGTP